jgi:hypothetical protein
MVQIKISISTSNWFKTQEKAADFLGVKNTSKKSIKTRCKKFNYDVEFY